MKCFHKMPFGAELLEDGAVRFRLWAPRAQRVSVALNGQKLQMCRREGGWLEATSREAGAGARYRFEIDHEHRVPDPASRYQPEGVHGASEVIDANAFAWECMNWRGRPWEETVLYELHVGTFSAEGTYAGAENKLDYLADLGITAVEVMPVSSFPGRRNWGYDGVLPYAPTNVYGRPDDFKHFIDAAHARNLMVFLDVVYNHFGPEGNYLPLYAPEFFTDRHHTPWGQAINFDGPSSRTVRDFFIHNALYWLEEYRIDGLRLDAVHAIHDDSRPDILMELAQTVRTAVGADRAVHLVLENDDNAAHCLERRRCGAPRWYTAQWNDDVEHAAHVLVTHECDGYYADYAANPAWHLGRCLAEGFSYQGEPSSYRDGGARGEASRELPPECFVSFLQNHDQVGNRALGERIGALAQPQALRAALAVLLLAPSPPLLFMGEEFGACTPFLFFCDFEPEIAAKAREGRRAEFSRFAQFSSAEARSRIPDPGSEETFLRSKLDWGSLQGAEHRTERRAEHGAWLEFYREVLACRRKEIVPRIKDILPGRSRFETLGERGIRISWELQGAGALILMANFGEETLAVPEPGGDLLYATGGGEAPAIASGKMAPLSAAWFINP